MQENIQQKAADLGRLIGQTDEYKALQRARQRVDDDREVVELLNKLGELEESLGGALRRGESPSEDAQREYESSFGKLQSNPAYQGLVAAQSNFEKVLGRVNEEISKGMQAGAQSRIILS